MAANTSAIGSSRATAAALLSSSVVPAGCVHGQSGRHVSAGEGDHPILLEAQLGQEGLQFLTAPVHLKHIHIEAALQAAAAPR
jgi:hypothetical protein